MNHGLLDRLEAIRQLLVAVHSAGAPLAAASKGLERAKFVELLLARALPAQYRFGTGCVTDAWGRMSGELDVVVELPFVPNVPSLSDELPKLYIAEGVAAAIEVKSDLSRQWDEAQQTAEKLSQLRRAFGGVTSLAGSPDPDGLSLLVVGYRGPAQPETLKGKLAESAAAGVLVIDSGIFAVKPSFLPGSADSIVCMQGPEALWGLICSLHWIASSLLYVHSSPLSYVSPERPPESIGGWRARV